MSESNVEEQAMDRLRELIREGLGLESGPGRELTPEVAAELRRRALLTDKSGDAIAKQGPC